MELELHKQPIRYYEIDLLRFLAALSVVLFHYTFSGYEAHQVSHVSFSTLGFVTKYGYLGVELFFMISGYVVLLSAQGKTVRTFLHSRITRLYPAFWVACTTTFLVERIWGVESSKSQFSVGVGQYLYNMTMLHEFFGVASIDGAYWSLTVEITFYFIVSLLIAYQLMPQLDLFLGLWILYIVAAMLSPAFGASPSSSGFFYLFFPRYAPLFIAGILFYLLQVPKKRTRLRYGLLIATYSLALRNGVNQAKELTIDYDQYFSPIVVVSCITLFFLIFLLITFQKLNLIRFTWLKWLGAITYPLYLLHENIGYIIFNLIGPLMNKYILLAGMIVSMVGLSYIINIFVEKRYSRKLGVAFFNLLERLDIENVESCK